MNALGMTESSDLYGFIKCVVWLQIITIIQKIKTNVGRQNPEKGNLS